MGAAIDSLPEALRAPVERWFERFGDSEHAEALTTLVACSEFAGNVLLRERDWIGRAVCGFGRPPSVADLDDSIPAGAGAGAALRRYRNRYLVHVLWREVFGLADLDETLASLTALADAMLAAALRHAESALAARYGYARNAAGDKVPLVVLGMGKLGGRELNFSSDVDVVFLYPEDGETDGPKNVSAHEYFGRLSRRVIALLDETTVDGFVFRIDTRLRPFGDSGPPVVSFDALESYLLQHGRDWERYAYVKARVVGSMPGKSVTDQLYGNLIRPFVYRRYIDYGVFESLREMHAMIASEVRRRELRDNVKLGPGGIREAEFIVQSLQLVRGGSEPALQRRALQEVLPLLVSERGLSEGAAADLRDAYRFLRRIENFLQAMRDRQTHDLPADDVDRARLCLAMGYDDWDALRRDIDGHRDATAELFENLAFREGSRDESYARTLERAWEGGAPADAWTALFERRGVADASGLAHKLVGFANETATRQIDAVSRERLQRFIPQLLLEVAQAERRGIALTRTLAVVERILRRSAYLSLLNENHGALARLVDLCARSSHIAGQIARYPVLLDELLDARFYEETVTRADLAAELDDRLQGVAGDSESWMRAVGQFQRSTMFRIAVADFNGKLPIMKVSDGLTWLAEVVLEETLRFVWSELTARHGVPRHTVDGAGCEAGFGVIAYGKLGGLELSYGSDLDVVFLHDSTGSKSMTDGEKPLDNGLFFGRLVRRLVNFLTAQTGTGQLYEIDTRLRPEGGKGLLVTSTEAFERYQEENAWTWEHQALLRARPVAGSAAIADEFERIRRDTLVERVDRDRLRDEVVGMRQKMRRELDRSDGESFDLKHGRGGIGDIEFLVQYLVLENAAEHPDVVVYTDNIRQLDALVAAGILERAVGDSLQDAYRDYRLRQHHLVLDDRQPVVSQDAFRERRDFVAETWDEWLA